MVGDYEGWMAAREPALFRLAVLLTDDWHAAQDLVQATLVKMYLAWDRIDRQERVDAYARRVLINEHRSTWRRQWRRREVATELVPEQPTVERTDGGASSEVWELLASLPPRQRAVVVLRYYEGLSEIEIAEVLRISPGTVKSQASRALASLRRRVPEVTP